MHIALTANRNERWRRHFIDYLSASDDPYVVLRAVLRGRQRGLSFAYELHERSDDIPMTL